MLGQLTYLYLSVSIFDIQRVAIIRGSLCPKRSEKPFADTVQFSPYKSRRIQAPLAVEEVEVLESYLYGIVQGYKCSG